MIETYDMRYFPQHVLLCTSTVHDQSGDICIQGYLRILWIGNTNRSMACRDTMGLLSLSRKSVRAVCVVCGNELFMPIQPPSLNTCLNLFCIIIINIKLTIRTNFDLKCHQEMHIYITSKHTDKINNFSRI